MGKKLAIKGHPTRGKEIIELLEMMGGKNTVYYGTDIKVIYTIDDKGIIRSLFFNDTILMKMEYDIFTLEEFLEKYPFKVDDKVIDEADGCPGVVCEMKWDEDVSDMKYCVAFGNGVDFGWFANDSINFFEIKKNENLEETQSNQDIDKVAFRKEFCERCGSQRCSGQDDELEYCERFKNLMDNSGNPSDKNHKMGPKSKLPSKYYEDKMEEIKSNQEYDELRMPLDDDENKFPPFEPMFKMNDELEYMVPDGYEITEVLKDKVFIKPIKSKHPKTYAECCDALSIAPYYNLRYHTYEHGYNEYATTNELCSLQDKLNILGKLLICRKAYWKIAGEEMGLDKPWDSVYGCGEWGYWIGYDINANKIYCQDSRILLNHLLVFPSEEMRDAFYDNFKDLIEQCKELL